MRSKEQADALAVLGITVLQLDLADEAAVIEAVKRNNSKKEINSDFWLTGKLINLYSWNRDPYRKFTDS